VIQAIVERLTLMSLFLADNYILPDRMDEHGVALFGETMSITKYVSLFLFAGFSLRIGILAEFTYINALILFILGMVTFLSEYYDVSKRYDSRIESLESLVESYKNELSETDESNHKELDARIVEVEQTAKTAYEKASDVTSHLSALSIKSGRQNMKI